MIEEYSYEPFEAKLVSIAYSISTGSKAEAVLILEAVTCCPTSS